MLQSIFSLDHK